MAGHLPSLRELDPAEAWKPWQPDRDNPWSLKWAAHLFRRAAFGGAPLALGADPWEALQGAVRDGLEETLEALFQEGWEPDAFERIMDSLPPSTSQMYYRAPGADGVQHHLQAWWLNRMMYTSAPLRERLTLFWHNHFATSIAKVKWPNLMLRQNQLFRSHALGKFGPLLLEVSRDPAMLIWLDSNSNVKGKPNENYAREVMELFTLGPGHYTEQDIREAARAFTGWHTSAERYGGFVPPGRENDGPGFVFNAAQHDGGKKTVLGQTGAWNGQDIVRILLEQPAAARFLAGKLYRHFISEAEAPPQRLLEPLARQLRDSDYDIGGLVRTMLRSRLFFSPHAYRKRIKSPVEYVLGLVRNLDAKGSSGSVAQALEGLGQALFAPPNVKGWEGGKAWLNSLTLVARHNLALSIITGNPPPHARRDTYTGQPAEPFRADVVRLVRQHGGKAPEQQVEFLLNLLLQGDCSPAARPKLVDYLKNQSRSGDPVRRLQETIHSVVLLPEYQLA